MEGTVKWFNRKKGYGFVAGDDGSEYFVHFTALPKGLFLNENDRVSFEAADTEKGKQAKNVKKIGGGEEKSAPQSEDSYGDEEAEE